MVRVVTLRLAENEVCCECGLEREWFGDGVCQTQVSSQSLKCVFPSWNIVELTERLGKLLTSNYLQDLLVVVNEPKGLEARDLAMKVLQIEPRCHQYTKIPQSQTYYRTTLGSPAALATHPHDNSPKAQSLLIPNDVGESSGQNKNFSTFCKDLVRFAAQRGSPLCNQFLSDFEEFNLCQEGWPKPLWWWLEERQIVVLRDCEQDGKDDDQESGSDVAIRLDR